MLQFKDTELILTPGNRVYHLNLKNEDIADDVILVGDPGRVEKISGYFNSIDFKSQHREFIAHTGTFNGKRITVLSTGIGTDNIDIVLNELDAAVNIDPVTRTLNSKRRSLNIIRLGTSGALQKDIPIDSFVVSSHGLGLDGLMHFYEGLDKINEEKIVSSFTGHSVWPLTLPSLYCIAASTPLYNKLKEDNFTGITATAPGFYGPQGREVRLKCAFPKLNDMLSTFNYNGLRITNFEMETSAMYGLGKLLGHQCVTVCVIIANRVSREFTTDYEKSVNNLIENSLNKITS
jgi:uridine phosphorylase